MAFEEDLEVIAFHQPSQVLEDLGAPIGEFGGVVFEDRFLSSVVDVHPQTVRGDLDIDRFFFILLDIQKSGEILGDGFEESLVLAAHIILNAGDFLGGFDLGINQSGGFRWGLFLFSISGIAGVLKIKGDLS